MAEKEEEVLDTSDYKLSKSGRKVKAHRIIFNKGVDDGKKGITEMKKSYKDFVEQYATKTVDEELKGNQHKLDKNKNGKLDKHDFKLLRKEDTVDESVFDWKNKSRQTSDSGKTKTYHDVKKTSTGTVYTKQFDKDGMSKGTGGDAAAKSEGQPKRGRGRPKKDKFAEAVEFLLSLSEEHFDDMIEEGFDAFIESFEQLDELSKTTLGSYARKAAASAVSHTAKAQHSTAQAQDARNRAKDPKLAFARSGNETIAKSQADRAVKSNVKAGKRLSGVSKAIDRLTK